MKKLIYLFIFIFCITPMIFAQDNSASNWQKATFAGGCFWCMEPPFDKLDGVKETISGYAGGKEKDPTYRQVASGSTTHAESVQIIYDPKKISYKKLLDVFWHNIDPTTKDRQFVDRGAQYRTAIFYHTAEQKKLAEQSKKEWEKKGTFKGPIVTEIAPVGTFYKAEEYHQDYYLKNPFQYKFYRYNSGRDKYLDKVWGKSRKK